MDKRPAEARAVPDAGRTCPVCGQPLHKFEDEVAIRCINQGCPAIVLQSITHFASRKAMDIEGLGWQTVTALLDAGLVTDYASIYELTDEQVAELERKGEKSAKKLIENIEALENERALPPRLRPRHPHDRRARREDPGRALRRPSKR